MQRKVLLPLVWRVAVAGAVGGALNAAHCWLTLSHEIHDLQWHIVPAGAGHGALLAVVAVVLSAAIFNLHAALRLSLLPVSGWVGGYISYVPLIASLGGSLEMFAVWKKPLEAWWPWQAFGLVTALAFLAWGGFRQLYVSRLTRHLACASGAGVGGSLWWWIVVEDGQWWYYCIPHGICWGSLVGLAVWSVFRGQALAVSPASPRSGTGSPVRGWLLPLRLTIILGVLAGFLWLAVWLPYEGVVSSERRSRMDLFMPEHGLLRFEPSGRYYLQTS